MKYKHKTTRLFLPFPPSVNGLFSGKTRRFKSDGYKAWLRSAKFEFDNQIQQEKFYAGFGYKGFNHEGKVHLTFLFKSPDKRHRDIDNLQKSLCDFLVNQNVIIDDDSRYVRSIYAEWRDDLPKAGVFIVVKDEE